MPKEQAQLDPAEYGPLTYVAGYVLQSSTNWVVARGPCIFHLIPARIYFTRGEENLWWHAI
jgi:hypothetical protein